MGSLEPDHRERLRTEKLLSLGGEDFVRRLGSEAEGDPFLQSAIESYHSAKSNLQSLELDPETKPGVLDRAQSRMRHAADELAENVQASKHALQIRLDIMDQELDRVTETHDQERERFLNYTRMRAEYDNRKRDYERHLSKLDALRTRWLDEGIDDPLEQAHRITLELHDVSLADAMRYALQQAGMAFVVRPNTVVIGTPEELQTL